MSFARKHQSLLAGISHQIGQPLTVLRGTLEMALLGEPSAMKFHDAIEEALQETDRLVALAGLLRELAAVEELGGVNGTVGLQGPAEEVLSDMIPIAEAKGIKVETDFSGASPIRGDAEHLRQIIMNLVDCFIQYAAEGATLRLATVCENSSVCLEIAVSETDLTPDILNALFQPFADRQRRPPAGTSGLGLAICFRAVEVLDGEITTRSGSDGDLSVQLKFPAQTQ